jgi:hypothetical protein
MHKLTKPQIYVFDNEAVANKLKDIYFVSEGPLE